MSIAFEHIEALQPGKTRVEGPTQVPAPAEIGDGELAAIKREHDHAKAVKSDDAAVPVHLWNERIFGLPLTPAQSKALETMRASCLWRFRFNILEDALHHLSKTHGEDWYLKLCPENKACHLIRDLGRWGREGLLP